MQYKQIFIALALASSTSAQLFEKKIPARQGKKCVGQADQVIKLGQKNQTLERCKLKCINDSKCEAMQYEAPKMCSLYYNSITMDAADDDTYCGRVKLVEVTGDAEDVTEAPTPAPLPAKNYIIKDYTKCSVETTDKSTTLTKGSQAECQAQCDGSKNCKAYMWNGKIDKCVIYKYRLTSENVIDVKPEGPMRVCAIVPKETSAPTASPVASIPVTASPVASVPVTSSPTASPVRASTKAPTVSATNAPTKSPTGSPTASPVAAAGTTECTLRATLDFDFGDEPNDAPYYGYHADYMAVTQQGVSGRCSYNNKNNLPSWCTYENSSSDGDSAYVANFDDDYYDDDINEMVTKEKIFVTGAAGSTFEFKVRHWFYGKDYYPDEWFDHMMAATLRIRNKSNPDQKDLNEDGWSHPVDMNTPTHKNGAQNPDYKGDFVVTVSCSDSCFCSASYLLL